MKLFPPAAPTLTNHNAAAAPVTGGGAMHGGQANNGNGGVATPGVPQVPSPMSTSGFFAKQERAFFAQPGTRKARSGMSGSGGGPVSNSVTVAPHPHSFGCLHLLLLPLH